MGLGFRKRVRVRVRASVPLGGADLFVVVLALILVESPRHALEREGVDADDLVRGVRVEVGLGVRGRGGGRGWNWGWGRVGVRAGVRVRARARVKDLSQGWS